ncbi:exodeoxyribonuclease V subunit beta [Leptospira langatensis]|uniref:RecBCD enzyme subunit RecB n=1 Tax=Leptospira langatensis TaxID=2484983 RepID=A0A5F1ZQ57_9LEPT|nr:UvrD-helicase domain-containing protein [Leptospira langatensis]TGK01845.1 exodeoxyribonuclease V subunit beta [Leptospira langatensis]TGL39450.1 exodeoxyribonuclease V subunit beta [Leptospira langatensis]
MSKSKIESAGSGSFADGIDIRKNGFIGASAGTGKTHTIVFLVLKILRDSFLSSLETNEPPIGIDSILVLTFTDKAASELRGRIRAEVRNKIQELEKIENPSLENSKELEYFLFQSSRLDQAYISTIHGFAHKILQEYSLELGQGENAELVDEFSAISKALYARMRLEFQDRYPRELLPYILTQANDSYNDGFARTTWESFVANLAVKKVSSPDSIELQPRPKEFPDLDHIRNVFQELSIAFPKLLQSQEGIKKKVHASTYKALSSRQVELQTLLLEINRKKGNFDPLSFTLVLKSILDLRRSKSKGLDAVLLTEDELKNANSEPSIAAYRIEKVQWERISSRLEALYSTLPSFIVSLVEDIASDSVQLKSEENSITYGDMILKLSEALSSHPSFIETLRRRFRFGIIDEFQDTDPEQYHIFRILFLEKEPSSVRGGSLFLIGDAKQSIYGFRGADLGTYLSAKQEYDTNGAFSDSSIVYPELDTNRRSLPELISSYNTLFSSANGDWFPILEEGFPPISYREVHAPEVAGKAVLYSDKSDRAALNAFRLSKEASSERMKEEYSKFLAEEILHLVSERSDISWKKDTNPNVPEKIRWSDIAVLIRGWNDAELLQRQFRTRGIPYTYHKQAGLYRSGEAIRIREILSCLDQEGSRDSFYKLLVSDLFCISPEDLQNYEEYPIESGEKRLLESWRRFARKRDYPGLFRSLLTESMLASPLENESLQDWERKITNFRQLFFFLSEKASKSDLSLSELVSYLESKIVSEEEEDDYLERDSEEDRVKILTMHACKGLEFPIVFLFGGFSGWGNTKKKFSEYRSDLVSSEGEKISKRILDLENKKEETSVINQINEDKRLYYVAVTRAMYKFYFPLLAEEDKKRPLELFRKSFQVALHSFPPSSSVAIIHEKERGSYESEWIQKGGTLVGINPSATREVLQKTSRSIAIWPDQAERRKIQLESYSSLDLFFQEEGKAFHLDETRSFKTDEEPVAITVLQNDLPSSNQMGNLLHQILETADFNIYQKTASPEKLPKEIKKSYKDILKSYGYGNSEDQLEFFADRIGFFLWNSLRTPLPDLQNSISLSQIKAKDRRHEVDFFLKVPEQKGGSDLLKGTLDLIFYQEGKYWILDWKSNRLESHYSIDPYSEAHLKEKVEGTYSLQLAIYSVVLDDWLKFKYGDEYDPGLLGGMYFLFLRGADEKMPGNGIFFQKLDPGFVQDSRKKIQETLSLKNLYSGEKE